MIFQSCATIGTPLGILSKVTCRTQILQATRLGFYELPQAAVIGTDTTILTKAVYDALLIDATSAGLRLPQAKLYAPELSGTEPVTYGSNDNTTPNGQTEIVGETIPVFTAKYTGLTPVQYGELNKVFGRGIANADYPTLGVQFFCGDFQTVVGIDNKAIPVRATFIGSPNGMQLHDRTQFMIRFELLKNWYEFVKVVDLGFNHNLL